MPVISLSFSQILDAASYQAILDNVSYHCTPQCGHVMSGAQSFRKVGQEYSLEGQRDKASETGTVPPNLGRLYYILRGTINLDEFLRGQNRGMTNINMNSGGLSCKCHYILHLEG